MTQGAFCGFYWIPVVEQALKPQPAALKRQGSAKETLSPSSEDFIPPEATLEHCIMFEFCCHFFPQKVATANWKGLAEDYIQYLTS